VDCESDRIVLERSTYWGSSYRQDRVDVFADRRSLEGLGLLLFAAIFHEGEEDLVVRLTHRASEIQTIRVEREALRRDSLCDIAVRPLWYDYHWIGDDEELPRHPLAGLREIDLRLTNEADSVVSEAELASRNVVCGFGSLSATSQLAELLLDLTRPWSSTTLIDMEGREGLESVAEDSAWLRIYLPGDAEWPSDLDELIV
jgi:hypothetical protein